MGVEPRDSLKEKHKGWFVRVIRKGHSLIPCRAPVWHKGPEAGRCKPFEGFFGGVWSFQWLLTGSSSSDGFGDASMCKQFESESNISHFQLYPGRPWLLE